MVAGFSKSGTSEISAGFLVGDAPNQSLQRLRIGPEIDAMKTLQRPRQSYWLGRIRCQNHWNDKASSVIELLEKSYNLPFLPRTDTVLTNKNGRRFYSFNLLSNAGVPKASASDILFIQPRFNILLGQLLRDLEDSWFVLAIVAHEHVKNFHFAVLSVQVNSIGETSVDDKSTRLRIPNI
jgi:hypothetical protein